MSKEVMGTLQAHGSTPKYRIKSGEKGGRGGCIEMYGFKEPKYHKTVTKYSISQQREEI